MSEVAHGALAANSKHFGAHRASATLPKAAKALLRIAIANKARHAPKKDPGEVGIQLEKRRTSPGVKWMYGFMVMTMLELPVPGFIAMAILARQRREL